MIYIKCQLLKCKSLEVEALRPVTPNTHHWSPHSAVPSNDWLFHLSAGCYWLWLRSRRCVRGCWFSQLFCGFTKDFVMICIVKEWVVRWYFIHFIPTTSNRYRLPQKNLSPSILTFVNKCHFTYITSDVSDNIFHSIKNFFDEILFILYTRTDKYWL